LAGVQKSISTICTILNAHGLIKTEFLVKLSSQLLNSLSLCEPSHAKQLINIYDMECL